MSAGPLRFRLERRPKTNRHCSPHADVATVFPIQGRQSTRQLLWIAVSFPRGLPKPQLFIASTKQFDWVPLVPTMTSSEKYNLRYRARRPESADISKSPAFRAGIKPLTVQPTTLERNTECKQHSLIGSHSEKWKSSKTASQRFLVDRFVAPMGEKRSLYPNGRRWRTSPKTTRNISSRPSCLR